MELEWQRRFEDVKADYYLANEQLIQDLIEARDQVSGSHITLTHSIDSVCTLALMLNEIPAVMQSWTVHCRTEKKRLIFTCFLLHACSCQQASFHK